MKRIKAIFKSIASFFAAKYRISLAAVFVFTGVSYTLMHSGGDYRNNFTVISADVVSYYNYLPAVFKYHDLKLERLPLRNATIRTADGTAVEKMSIGLACHYLPFYLMADAYTKIMGLPYDVYDPPYAYMLCLSAICYLFAGLLFLRKVLMRYFSDVVITAGLATIYLGTHFLYFTAYNGPLTHVYTFALLSLFLWLNILWHERPTWKNSLLTGLVFGSISLIRPSNITVILIPLLWNIHDRELFRQKLALIRMHWKKLVLVAFAAFVAWIPQFIYWKIATGHFLFYSYGSEHFFWDAPMIHKGFLSYRNGWLVYCPVMIFSLAGFFLLRKKYKQFLIPFLVYFVISVYIIFCWWCWWYVGFGLRAMIDFYAVLSIPLCAFLAQAFKMRLWFRIPLITIWFLLMFYGAFLNWQYRNYMIHFDSMTKKAYWSIFMKTKLPNEFYSYLKTPDYEAAVKGTKR